MRGPLPPWPAAAPAPGLLLRRSGTRGRRGRRDAAARRAPPPRDAAHGVSCRSTVPARLHEPCRARRRIDRDLRSARSGRPGVPPPRSRPSGRDRSKPAPAASATEAWRPRMAPAERKPRVSSGRRPSRSRTRVACLAGRGQRGERLGIDQPPSMARPERSGFDHRAHHRGEDERSTAGDSLDHRVRLVGDPADHRGHEVACGGVVERAEHHGGRVGPDRSPDDVRASSSCRSAATTLTYPPGLPAAHRPTTLSESSSAHWQSSRRRTAGRPSHPSASKRAVSASRIRLSTDRPEPSCSATARSSASEGSTVLSSGPHRPVVCARRSA